MIPEIDIVTKGQLISHVLEPDSVDYVIASHVWEHVPDFLGWLESNLIVLRPGGRMAVAYPDKRYTFDMCRRSSSLSDVLAAYIEKRTRPTITQLSDYLLNVVSVTPQDAWSGATNRENAKTIHAQNSIVQLLREADKSGRYVDAHCWVFEDLEMLQILENVRPFISRKFIVLSFFPPIRELERILSHLREGLIA
ncbi:MAG: hypothetical protein HC869_11210 [Rhodospirillales bacterium]|nr:hypothetical protein [Rhodospirillales bacterium]